MLVVSRVAFFRLVPLSMVPYLGTSWAMGRRQRPAQQAGAGGGWGGQGQAHVAFNHGRVGGGGRFVCLWWNGFYPGGRCLSMFTFD